jgi:DNA-binding response OmpR family regulator
MTNHQPLALVVEDSPTQALEIVAALRAQGFQVITASDGVAGLEAAYQDHPALIVLDVHLPEMNGYQVCRRLKRNPDTTSIPVIMLTSVDSSSATLAGIEAGADDYIAKDQFATENLTAALMAFNLVGDPSDAHE